MKNPEEIYLLEELKKGNKAAFTLLFQNYFNDLVLFAGNILRNKNQCEDIVQNIFLKLWTERSNIIIESSLKSFLLKSVKNACLDEIRHQHVVNQHESYVESVFNIDEMIDTENYILFSDLSTHLEDALTKLPPKYRESFEMNRLKGMKYKEIAEELQVSERTIEVRISKALCLLRKYLSDFFVTVSVYFLLKIH